MMHIIERFILHFFCSTALTLMFYFAIRYWQVRNVKVNKWVPFDKTQRLVFAGLLVFALLPLREPWDVYAQNNTVLKSYFDILSWLLGPAVSVLGLTKYGEMK